MPLTPAEYVARRNRYMRNRTLDHAPAALVDDINRASDDMDKATAAMNRFIDVILDMPQITSRQNSEHAAAVTALPWGTARSWPTPNGEL